MRRQIAVLFVAAAVHAVLPSAASAQTAISFGQTLIGSIAASGDVDTYTFSAAANDRVLVTMAVSSGSLDPDIELYDPTGVLVCSAEYWNGGSVDQRL